MLAKLQPERLNLYGNSLDFKLNIWERKKMASLIDPSMSARPQYFFFSIRFPSPFLFSSLKNMFSFLKYSKVRLSLVDLRWAQLYVSQVHIDLLFDHLPFQCCISIFFFLYFVFTRFSVMSCFCWLNSENIQFPWENTVVRQTDISCFLFVISFEKNHILIIICMKWI